MGVKIPEYKNEEDNNEVCKNVTCMQVFPCKDKMLFTTRTDNGEWVGERTAIVYFIENGEMHMTYAFNNDFIENVDYRRYSLLSDYYYKIGCAKDINVPKDLEYIATETSLCDYFWLLKRHGVKFKTELAEDYIFIKFLYRKSNITYGGELYKNLVLSEVDSKFYKLANNCDSEKRFFIGSENYDNPKFSTSYSIDLLAEDISDYIDLVGKPIYPSCTLIDNIDTSYGDHDSLFEEGKRHLEEFEDELYRILHSKLERLGIEYPTCQPGKWPSEKDNDDFF